MKFARLFAFFLAAVARGDSIRAVVDEQYPQLFELYQHFHTHPELSSHEEKTSERVAAEFKSIGLDVAQRVGGFGVVGVLKNGAGPTLLLRTELDALPVKEQTGLPYASTARTTNDSGAEVDVMHACGHDIHMTALIGTARVLAELKDRWSGTLVFIAQPAEETGTGAKAMLADGLFTKFPKPDYCLALHDNAELPAGSVATVEGFIAANVDSVDITIRGVGGHGAYPHKTKDPIVLAAETVVALQTIVSREIKPGDPAVVTVGSIHGGTKHNIIPDEVKLQLTVRSYSDAVRTQLLAAIERITRGVATTAGLPEDRMPIVKVDSEYTPATYNDPALTKRLTAVFKNSLGESNVLPFAPTMGGEDFSEFGRTQEKVPICLFWLGAVNPEAVKESQATGKPLPSLHSSLFAPVPEPTITTGITAMTSAVLDLAGKK